MPEDLEKINILSSPIVRILAVGAAPEFGSFLFAQELAEHRKRSRRDVVEQEVRDLLQRKIRSPLDLSWDEVRVVLQEEHAQLPEDVEEAYLHEVFNRVCDEDKERRAGAFSSELLRCSVEELGPELPFEAVCERVACQLGSELLRPVPEAELRIRWENWRRHRLTEAAEAFKVFLRQSEVLATAARDPRAVRGEGTKFQELCDELRKDKRYLRLELLPTQRRRLIIERLEEVALNSKLASQDADSDAER